MKRGIVAFEMPILRPEGKVKASQNRCTGDRDGVIEALAGRAEDGAQGGAGAHAGGHGASPVSRPVRVTTG